MNNDSAAIIIPHPRRPVFLNFLGLRRVFRGGHEECLQIHCIFTIEKTGLPYYNILSVKRPSPKGLPNMKKQKLYVETTLFNYFFDKDRDAHAATVKLFKEITLGKYEPYTSTYVTDELENAAPEKRDKMIGLIKEYGIAVLAPNDETMRLAELYIVEGIIPKRYLTDSLHIAIATVNDLDMIVSMNFQHIVKRKTKIGTGNINALNGYRTVEICSPMEVIEDECD
jgi:predicted nucleic acid-binding protein